MPDADEAELIADEHQGVPPVGVLVTVTKLESADGASRKKLASLGKRNGCGVRHMTARGELGNDLGDLRAKLDVAQQLIDLGDIKQRQVEIRQFQRCFLGRRRRDGCFRIHAAADGGGVIKRCVRRRGRTRTALVGAGQMSWQTPHPVQMSDTTIGIPFSTFIAPDTGQRSAQTVQNEV